MPGNTFGNYFRITTWGESHGKALGVVVDGCPAGLPLGEDDIQLYLDRRKPGARDFATKRREDDLVEILSGVFEGRTTGTPISMIIYNKDHSSADYADIARVFRPGHADYGYHSKFGIRDYRGGGRSSGRETAARVAAGAVACVLLSELGIKVNAYVIEIGGIKADRARFDMAFARENSLCVPDREACGAMTEYLRDCAGESDSAGGIVECVITGVKPGLGEPVFDKLDAELAKAVFSIGGVKGFEIGAGFAAARMRGSEHNDPFARDGGIHKLSNNAGGILGGISDGDDIIFRAAFKPTPSIARIQRTVDTAGSEREISVKGRHDPLIPPRAAVVVECMAALTVADYVLAGSLSRAEHVKDIYSR